MITYKETCELKREGSIPRKGKRKHTNQTYTEHTAVLERDYGGRVCPVGAVWQSSFSVCYSSDHRDKLTMTSCLTSYQQVTTVWVLSGHIHSSDNCPTLWTPTQHVPNKQNPELLDHLKVDIGSCFIPPSKVLKSSFLSQIYPERTCFTWNIPVHLRHPLHTSTSHYIPQTSHYIPLSLTWFPPPSASPLETRHHSARVKAPPPRSWPVFWNVFEDILETPPSSRMCSVSQWKGSALQEAAAKVLSSHTGGSGRLRVNVFVYLWHFLPTIIRTLATHSIVVGLNWRRRLHRRKC